MALNQVKARALFDFAAETSNELSFNVNDIFTITLASDEDLWWSAQNSVGQTGLIPANYVEIINDEPTSAQQITTIENTQHDYVTTDHNYLHFQSVPPMNYPAQTEQGRNSFSNDTMMNDLTTFSQEQTYPESTLNQKKIDEDNSFDSLSTTSTRYDTTSTFVPIISAFNDQYMTAADSAKLQDSFSPAIHNTWQQNNMTLNQSEPCDLGLNNLSVSNSSVQTNSTLPFNYNQTVTTERNQEQISSLDDIFFSSVSSTEATTATGQKPADNISDLPLLTIFSPQSTSDTSLIPIDNHHDNNPSISMPLSTTKSEEMIKSSTPKANVKERFSFTLGRKKGKQELDKKLTMSEENLEQSAAGATNVSKAATMQPNSSINSTKLNSLDGDVKAAKPRFFDKHGITNYLLHECKTKLDERFQISYDEREGGIHWLHNPTMPPFTCRIEETSKGSKLAGVKSFMEYKIHTTIFGNRVVARRYKQFDWFYTQLVTKFRFICIPQLPEKQITGIFDQEFVAERQRQLEKWLNRICHHPVLCASYAVQHFLTCERTESNDKEWKIGKRRIESDELKEAMWLYSVSFIDSNLSNTEIQSYIDTFAQHQYNLEIQIRNLNQGLVKHLERYPDIYEREIQRIGETFAKFQKVLITDSRTPGNAELSESILKISSAYNEIAELYKTKASDSLRAFNERTQEYIGLLGCFPMILGLQKSSAEFIRGLQQRPPSDFNAILCRSQVLNYAVLAEINFFQKEKVKDLNLYLKTLMNEQIEFYEKIQKELKDAVLTIH